MNKNVALVGIAAVIVGIGIGYVTWGSAGIRPGSSMMADGAMRGQNIDQHFIEQMIPHHEGAIEMSKIALERSKQPEVLQLANSIIASQQKEIDDMTTWYQSWFGSAPAEGSMGMMHMGSMEGDTDVLASIAAANFDREFLEQMIPHHEMALMMVAMLAAGTERPEMKQLAENIRTSQSREIELMQGWLKSGFGPQQ